MPPDEVPTPPGPVGLRERKKARTRAAIQHEALRLFRRQGYEATTVEQIAAAVEVSPSTFFRYFPTKEDVILSDGYDPLLFEVFRSQPADLAPVEALRRTVRAVFAAISEDELGDMRQRMELAFAVPDLRAAALDQLARTIRQVTELLAERLGRPQEDFALRTLAGAVLGVMLAAELHWAEFPGTDVVALMDEALAHLQAGFPL